MMTPQAEAAPRTDDGGAFQPGAPAHLRQVLGAAAVSAGLGLAPAGVDGVLSDAQARACARAWGLDESEHHVTPAVGGGVVVVLVDGLGLQMLQERKGHAPRLRAWLSQMPGGATRAGAGGTGGAARTCAPSTTAAALSTIGTGALPGVTGMVGFSVLNPLIDRGARDAGEPDEDDNLCLITWDGRAPDPRTWQDVPTIFQRLGHPEGPAGQAPLAVTVGPARFAGSGLTQAALRGAAHLGADRMEDRAHLAAHALRRGTPLVYLYVGELDHAGHLYGWRSDRWLAELERLDAMLSQLVRKVPAGTRVVLTADHGMVDTDADHRIDVTVHPDLGQDLVGLAGEPRFAQLYVPGSRTDLAEEVAHRWREHLGERAVWVGTREEAPELLGPVGPRARSVLGDVLVAMAGTWVVVDPRVHPEAARRMPGVHGSLTDAEMTVPLLVVRT